VEEERSTRGGGGKGGGQERSRRGGGKGGLGQERSGVGEQEELEK